MDFRFGFCLNSLSLMEPDVEQDLDWTVAGNQSKTVTDLKCFVFIQRGVLVLSWKRFTTEPSRILTKPALKNSSTAVFFF